MKLLKDLSRMHVLPLSFLSMLFLAITFLFNGCASVLGIAGENIETLPRLTPTLKMENQSLVIFYQSLTSLIFR